jgi:Zn finger protein HypA/HybF involved in hydrogenase expression
MSIYQHDIDTDPRNPANQDPTLEPDNMYCQECSTEHPSDLIFCPMCGERMVEVNA